MLFILTTMRNIPKIITENCELVGSFKKAVVISTSFIDFASNDYLGFSKNEGIFDEVHQLLNRKIKITEQLVPDYYLVTISCIKKQKTLLPVSTIQKPR
jgi:hypothetical protein